MHRPPLVVWLTAAALVLTLAAGGVWWARSGEKTAYAEAVVLAPAGTQRIGFTDWSEVRRLAGVSATADSSDGVRALLDEGYDRDLTSASALLDSAAVLQEKYGFSPATVEWEVFAQSAEGAVDILRVPEQTSYDDIATRLQALGYLRPATPDGVWRGGPDVVASAGATATPELQHIVLLRDERLVLTSDSAEYVLVAARAATGDSDRVSGLDDVAASGGEAVSALVQDGAHVCEHLAMANAAPADQDRAAQLVAAAGRVSPLSAYAMSLGPDGLMRISLGFPGAEQATGNAQARATLAAGPAPGQGGTFAERFSIESTVADGSVVTITARPLPRQAVMSDLGTGPVLFATC